jgi:hypothetical protein
LKRKRLLPAISLARRSGFGLTWSWPLGLAILHGMAIWVGMGGWEGVSQPWPLARHDHPQHFHNAVVARALAGRTWFDAGYDPSFMSGYSKSILSDSSATISDLVVGRFGGDRPARAYKLYVLIAAASVPWLVAGAGRLWGMGPGAVGVAVFLFLVYLWTDFPLSYLELGMVAFFVAVPLGLLTTAAVTAYLERGGFGRWLAAALGSAFLVLVHVTAPLVAAPATLVSYLVAVLAAHRAGTRFPISRHVGLWSIPAVVLGVNAFWWLPGLWLAATKGRSDLAFAHPEPVIRRLWEILGVEAPIESVLWAGAAVGLAVLVRRRCVAAAGLGTFLAAGLFWGYLAGAFRSLDPLQPGRQTYALYTAAALASGIGGAEIAARVRTAGTGTGRLDRWLVLGAILVGFRLFGPSLAVSIQSRLRGSEPFLSSRPTPRLRWVIDRVKRHVAAGERLLYEEGGRDRPGHPDLFQGGRYSGLLPHFTGVEVLGGPFLHVTLQANFTQFGEGRLFGKEGWGRDHFVRYARLYRPAAILCWSPHARAFCRANPDLVTVREDDGVLLIGRVEGFAGDAIVGTAQVEAEPGRLELNRTTPGVDGTVVLRYHSVPCLRTRPQVPWDSVYLERDPVPFIRLQAPPGRVTLELGFPPEVGSRASRRH